MTSTVPIGLLGGSFDPIHLGHLQLARDALVQLQLAAVRFVPAGHPWQKRVATGATQRAHMVGLAIRGEPRFVLDMHEVERTGATYTVDTLRALRAELGDQAPLVLIMGGDQMQRLDTWHEWQKLLDLAHIAVARRNGAVLTLSWPLQEYYNSHWAAVDAVRLRPAGAIVDIEMTPVDASATETRALLAQPPSADRDARLAAIVPVPVLDYIRANSLYQ
ncbi:MAG: nicotinate-nucleotide adenylyltransferase [Gemmatimonadota bacterium]